MALGSVLAGILLVVMAVSWYGLQVVALRDLVRRPQVRGDNKLLWVFAILCIPYAGALSYLTIGPIGFMPRPVRPPLGRTSRIVTTPGHRPVHRTLRRAGRRPLIADRPGPAAMMRQATLAPRRLTMTPKENPPVPDPIHRDIVLSQQPARDRSMRAADGAIRWPRGATPPLNDHDSASTR